MLSSKRNHVETGSVFGSTCRRSFGDIADVYDKTRSVPDKVLHKFFERILGEEILKSSDAVILDDGVGTGRTIEPLLDLGLQLVGLDLSREMIEKMREKVRKRGASSQIDPIISDVRNLPFPPESFDLVISIHVLHLIKSWKKAIQEASRVMKPGGLLVIVDHKAPEMESEIGKKYFELCERNRASTFSPGRILKLILNKTYENRATKRMKFLKLMLDFVSRRRGFWDGWGEIYLRKVATFMEIETIVWKEVIDISEFFERLNKRLLSYQWTLPLKVHEKVMLELGKWKDEEVRKNGPQREIKREFRIIKVRFKKPLLIIASRLQKN